MNSKHPLIVEPIGLEIEQLARPVDWSALFGRAAPVELEIGCGKGTFITEQARARPDVNFFGIEWAKFFWRYTCDRLRRNGCLNARAVRAEAALFLDEFVPESSLAALHIYFPDPWPKARHHKRRLINDRFILKARRVLTPGGTLNIVTDHENYWQNIEPAVRNSDLHVIDYHPPGSAKQGEFVGTNFERKYAREGRPFHAISARKQ